MSRAVRNVGERLGAARAQVAGGCGDQALERVRVPRHPRLPAGALAQLPTELVPQVAVVHAVHLPAVPSEEAKQLVGVLRLRQPSVEQRRVDPSGAGRRLVHRRVVHSTSGRPRPPGMMGVN